MKNSYCIEYGPNWWECEIEIDPYLVLPTSKPGEIYTTGAAIKNMVEYWTGWQDRLKGNEGDYVKTFLQQLAREINYIQIQDLAGINSVIDVFKNREGWCPMDGSFGIWIKQMDDFEFSHSDYQVYDHGSIADQEAASV